MKNSRSLEIGTGLFVLLGFAALFFLTTQLPSSGLKLAGDSSGYRLTAYFDNVGDLKGGSPVTMGGVRIGRLESVSYDATQFKAVAVLRIDNEYNQIPDDSDASIQTAGLLGGKYVGIGPGGSETFYQDGGQIDFTQSAIVLETLINRFFANFASSQGQDKGQPAAASGAETTTESDAVNK